ncbi:beta-glucosidase [Olsenella sp. AM05-17]|uniref:glycoside hydrolase family 3 N-terminal domain-containing protein n=1 Tax=unclassified Olsenella TaxID=2638792 RepID=UPI000E503BF1|nr:MULTISPECIES: glycoside hydrolase family 3 N-terminal domain-containing protein [unclassified Olsenella]RHJ91548.1 beta-glucosidase [Olsenella sp. AM05-7]RHJ96925.1 beta-glucosidase [Olsenella sp. AM05-17]
MGKKKAGGSASGVRTVSRARKVGRVIKTILKSVLVVVLAVAMVGVNVMLPNSMISRMVNNIAGYQQSWDNSKANTAGLDLDYYKADYDKDSIGDAEKQLDRQIANEGYVLLKNDGNTMPFEQGTTFSFFGESVKNLTATQSVLTQFTGAKGNSNQLKDSFESRGFGVNQTLMDFYTKGAGSKYTMGTGSINFGAAEDFRINECPLSELESADGVLDSTKDTVPVFVMRRVAGEGRDMPRSMYNHATSAEDKAKTYLEPDSTELEILQYINDNFDNGVVILNTASALNLGWLEQFPNIKSVLFVPSTGRYGTDSLADIFAGEVSPSGKTVDTFEANSLNSPAAQNYGDYQYIDGDGNLTGYSYVSYAEGIYVGYRYYETRYEDAVLGQGNAGDFDYDSEVVYPFGYGLSYTTFDWSNYQASWDGTTCTVSVDVTNTGGVAGKDVVEVYAQSPYTDYDRANGVEKSAVQLVNYGKTKLLEPGETQTVSVTFDQDMLKAYDANGAKTYILDAGTYYVTAAHDSHDAVNNVLAAKGANVAGDASRVSTYVPSNTDVDTTTYATDAKSGAEITNLFDDAKGDVTYLTRADWEGTFPQHDGTPLEGDVSTWGAEINAVDENGNPVSYAWGKVASPELIDRLKGLDSGNPVSDATITDTPVYGQNNGISLIDLRGKDYNDPMWNQLLDELSAEDYRELVGHSGYGSNFVQSIGKPFNIDADTAAGLIYGGTGMMFCSPVVMAQTWNQDLASAYGAMIGNEANIGGTTGWYAPSMNIHRTPFTGRNGEYYSEDPVISGTVASLEIKGAAEKGVYSTIKHFALNDQENHRGDGGIEQGCATWSNEQAIREIYVKPFDICMHVGTVDENYVEQGADGSYSMATTKVDACQAIMSAFNRVGATWAGGNYALLTGLARNEWGFNGWIVTDSANSAAPYMDSSQMIRAGGDSRLRSNENNYQYDENNSAEYHYAREAIHHLLYVTANSKAMEGAMPGSAYAPGLQAVDKVRIGVTAGGAAVIALVFWTGWRNHKKRAAERDAVAADAAAAGDGGEK